jgi:hypothetical protein
MYESPPPTSTPNTSSPVRIRLRLPLRIPSPGPEINNNNNTTTSEVIAQGFKSALDVLATQPPKEFAVPWNLLKENDEECDGEKDSSAPASSKNGKENKGRKLHVKVTGLVCISYLFLTMLH